MKQTEEFRKIKAQARDLRNLHKMNPKLHEWVPMQLMSTDSGHSMELGCRCGMWVWIDAEEVRTF